MLDELTSPWMLLPEAIEAVRRVLAADPAQWSLEALLRRRGEERQSPITVESGVAEIGITGVMTKGVGMMQLMLGGYSTSELTAAVEQAAADPNVGAIMLRVDSPGGSTAGLAELSDAIYAARRRKAVVAQVEGTAASAAYRVASQADAIYAHRADRVGSIGTIIAGYDVSRQAEMEGVKPVIATTGPMKALGFPGTVVTDDQRAYLQRQVETIQQDFDAELKRGRRLTDKQLERVKSGEVWQASEAAALRLVDGVQTTAQTRAELQRRVAAAQKSGRGSARQMTAEEGRRRAALADL